MRLLSTRAFMDKPCSTQRSNGFEAQMDTSSYSNIFPIIPSLFTPSKLANRSQVNDQIQMKVC
jgi:hypothetical protein